MADIEEGEADQMVEGQMTRDEAIEKACEIVKGRLDAGYGSSVAINKTEEVVLTYDSTGEFLEAFEWKPPLRIPPKGTPVMWTEKNGIKQCGISLGKVNNNGMLEVRIPGWEGFADENWIELQEVKP